MMSGSLSLIAIPIRPFMVVGKPPPMTSVQLSPPSVDFQSALPGPPLFRNQGPRTRSQLAAKRVLGSPGRNATSTNPALSLMCLTSSQVSPPSVVR